MNQKIYIVVAVDEAMGIGKDGKLPWHLASELKYFQKVTSETKSADKQNVVIMGRTTWESIPEAHRPLKGRKNVVMTRNENYEAEGALVTHSLDEAFEQVDENSESVFVIGGAQVFDQMMADSRLHGIYLTKIKNRYDCDTFFPEIPEVFGEPQLIGEGEDQGTQFQYLLFERSNNSVWLFAQSPLKFRRCVAW